MITRSATPSESSFVDALSAARTSGRQSIVVLPRSFGLGGMSRGAPAAEPRHDRPEEEQYQAPPEVDVELQGPLVHRRLREARGQPVERQQRSEQGEEDADGQANIHVHGR